MTTTTDRPAIPSDLVPVLDIAEHRVGATPQRVRRLREKGQLRVWKHGGPKGPSFVSLADWDALFDLADRSDPKESRTP